MQLYEDLLHQFHEIEKHGDAMLCHKETLQGISKYFSMGRLVSGSSETEGVTPLILHGPPGSGKSNIMATVAREFCTEKDWTKAMCLTRFIGCSPHTETQQQLISSIAEQLCLLLQIPTAWAFQVSKNFSMWTPGR